MNLSYSTQEAERTDLDSIDDAYTSSCDSEGSSVSSSPRCHKLAGLVDTSVLRGTTPHVLLRPCGSELRSAPNEIASDTKLAELTFAKSFQVSAIDIFVSHSWQAPWFQKYIALTCYFNGPAAVFLGVCASAAWITMAECRLAERLFPWLATGTASAQLLLQVIIIMACLAVLFFWQHLLNVTGIPTASVFLDKVCIHQSDAEKKKRGITSIGGIIARSKTLLVAWDYSYFSRLWCPYEIAAFNFANPDGKIVVLPVETGRVIASLSAAGIVQALGISLLHFFFRRPDEHFKARLAFYVFMLFPYLVVSIVQQANTRRLADLEATVSRYSVKNAESFCCSNGHVHPETGTPLPCDRDMVFEAIADWQGRGELEAGLEAFDKLVRQLCRQTIEENLGHCGVPYRFVLLTTLWHAIVAAIIGYYRIKDLYHQPCSQSVMFMVLPFEVLLFNEPLCLALMFCVTKGLQKRSLPAGLQCFLPCLVGTSFQALVWELYFLCLAQESLIIYFLLACVKGCSVFLLYFSSGRARRTARPPDESPEYPDFSA
eukprot:TRINITY_DN93076_c0_g1_i1.p1 TRINITY_DN93076_c0_g1~~TRINITY_DN93076_c0_g1_i1.p1  ORF type:complete len:544 (+),score=91.52 TRINITY_DN93076_c0_g1_i1:24-1655(+)